MNQALKLASSFLACSILLLPAVLVRAEETQQQSPKLIPAFVNLPYDHNILPDEYMNALKSPQTDLRAVAASFMERKRQFMLRWDSPKRRGEAAENFPESLAEVELVGLFPEKYLESMLEHGQLNVHQVGHSRGVCEPAIRAHAEDYYLGIHLENKYDESKDSRLHYLRPKYGFLLFEKPCGIKTNPFRLIQYGPILLVYADAVKYRSSYTYGDSLSSYCEPWAITMHPLDPAPLTMLRPPGKDETANCRFVEAQIWGPVEVSDIKEFRIPRTRKDLLERLNATGKPVFSYDREKMEENDTYVDICDSGLKRGEPLNEQARELLKRERVAATSQ